MRAETAPAAVPLPFLALMGGLAAVGPFTIDLYLPAFPTLQAHFHTTEAAVQGTLSAYFLGLAVGQMGFGPLIDRFGRIPPLFVGLAVYVVASLGCAVAPSIGALVVARFFQALGACAGMVVSRAVLRDLYGPRDMARVLSMILLVMGLAPIVAPMIGSAMSAWLGWPALFLALAVYGSLLLFAVHHLLQETLRERSARLELLPLARIYAAILRNRTFLGYALAGGIAQSGLFAYIASSSFVFVGVFELTPTGYALLFGCNAAGLIAASQVNALLLRRFDPEQILPWTLGAFALAGLTLLATASLQIGGLIGVAAPLFVAVASLGFCFPNTTAAAMAPVADRAGMASALVGTIQFGLAGLTSYFTGRAFDGTALPMAAVIAACGVLALLGLLVVPRTAATAR